jgi:hypothetical protein
MVWQENCTGYDTRRSFHLVISFWLSLAQIAEVPSRVSEFCQWGGTQKLTSDFKFDAVQDSDDAVSGASEMCRDGLLTSVGMICPERTS